MHTCRCNHQFPKLVLLRAPLSRSHRTRAKHHQASRSQLLLYPPRVLTQCHLHHCHLRWLRPPRMNRSRLHQRQTAPHRVLPLLSPWLVGQRPRSARGMTRAKSHRHRLTSPWTMHPLTCTTTPPFPCLLTAMPPGIRPRRALQRLALRSSPQLGVRPDCPRPSPRVFPPSADPTSHSSSKRSANRLSAKNRGGRTKNSASSLLQSGAAPGSTGSASSLGFRPLPTQLRPVCRSPRPPPYTCLRSASPGIMYT